MTKLPTLTGAQILDERVEDWRFLLGRLHGWFDAPSYGVGLQFVARVGAAADALDHHPEIDLHYAGVGVRLVSHDAGGITERDISLARTISVMAAELGLTARPQQVQQLDWALNTHDIAEIKPFWKAVLGAVERDGDLEGLYDAVEGGNVLWFQETAEIPTPAMKFHLDIAVPHDVAEQRLSDALAAGGTLVSDERAKAFWVIADAQGNTACICTWQDRD